MQAVHDEVKNNQETVDAEFNVDNNEWIETNPIKISEICGRLLGLILGISIVLCGIAFVLSFFL